MQFDSKFSPNHESRFSLHNPVFRLLIVLFLFITAFSIRLYHIKEPPLDFAAHRQYHSAHIARGLYFENLDSIPEWRKKVASINKERESTLEPQLMEHIVSFSYRIIGGEHLWIARLLSSFFWIVGGIFLYLIARKIASPGASLFSAAFYLFLPYSISASRSFQPDPLMVMMLLVSLFMMLRYYDEPSRVRFLIVATVSSLAIFVKPMCIFLIFGAYISISVYRYGIVKSIITPRFLIFSVISLLPTFTFYLYESYVYALGLRAQANYSILPSLILSSYYWKQWFVMIGRVVGFVSFTGAIIGFWLFQQHGLQRAFMAGLWIGYFVFGLVFTYHIHTHDYYHLQLIPVIALSLGPIGAWVMNRLSNILYARWRLAIPCIVLLIVFVVIGFNSLLPGWKRINPDTKNKLKMAGQIVGVNPQFIKFINPDFESEVRIAKEIGKILDHNTNTIALAVSQGSPLAYHGELSVFPCPDDVAARIQKEGLKAINEKEILKDSISSRRYFKGSVPEYFIVTDLERLESHPGLKDFFLNKYHVLAQNDDYLIFDLRKTIEKVD